MIQIAGKIYELVHVNRNGWIAEAFRERYSEVLERYDYIIGDWGYSQLRLKGFFRDNNPKATKDTSISSLVDYINEYCNFGCAYFVLERVQLPGVSSSEETENQWNPVDLITENLDQPSENRETAKISSFSENGALTDRLEHPEEQVSSKASKGRRNEWQPRNSDGTRGDQPKANRQRSEQRGGSAQNGRGEGARNSESSSSNGRSERSEQRSGGNHNRGGEGHRHDKPRSGGRSEHRSRGENRSRGEQREKADRGEHQARGESHSRGGEQQERGGRSSHSNEHRGRKQVRLAADQAAASVEHNKDAEQS